MLKSLCWSVCVGVLAAAAPAFSQTNHVCYRITQSGQVINLEYMCGGNEPSEIQAESVAEPVSDLGVETEEAREDFATIMEEAGFFLWNDGRFNDIAFDVWVKRGGGGFYYFLFNEPIPEDHGDPEVVVFFDQNNAVLNEAFAAGCYYTSFGQECRGDRLDMVYNEQRTEQLLERLARIPAHRRYEGPCLFTWQIDSNGNQCGSRAAIVRPGGL